MIFGDDVAQIGNRSLKELTLGDFGVELIQVVQVSTKGARGAFALFWRK